MTRKIGSILHGAYGDYYWQATSLKLLVERNPGTKLYLFSAVPARRLHLQRLDFSFAECFLSWEEMSSTPVDEFLQYQVLDGELKQDVPAKSIAAFLIDAWEGAVLRAKVEQSRAPLEAFMAMTFARILI